MHARKPYPPRAADLLKRHAERHDKREQSGLNSQPKPGRMKGSTKKRPSLPSASSQTSPNQSVSGLHVYHASQQGGTSASTSGAELLESSAPNSAPGSVASHPTSLPSPPIVDDYDHNRKLNFIIFCCIELSDSRSFA